MNKVFGDAEWIGVLEASEGQGQMSASAQGLSTSTMFGIGPPRSSKGGKRPYNRPKAKYGYR